MVTLITPPLVDIFLLESHTYIYIQHIMKDVMLNCDFNIFFFFFFFTTLLCKSITLNNLSFFGCVPYRVFVFADPAMFPETLLNAVRADVECGALDWDALTHQRQVLLHTLQAGLGRECHGRQLTQAMEVCICVFVWCIFNHCPKQMMMEDA